jgi:acetyl esterase/lipase
MSITIDSARFRPEAVSEETHRFNQGLRERFAGPGLADLGVEKMREAGLGPPAPRSPRAVEREIAGPAGSPLALRILAPDNPAGAYLHFHGGGLIMGSAAGQDAMLEAIAEATRLACVSVEYRLAPEHPYPAAWDDSEAAALWLAENVASEFGGSFLAIGGESAGATLAVPTLLRMRDRHGFTGFGAAVLTYGNYDTSGTPSNRWNGQGGLVIRDVDIAYCSGCYAPDPASRRDPDMSALYADLHDMPPALFSVGTLDAFLDDSLFLASRWIAAGNEAELAVYPGAPHGFTLFPHPCTAEATGRIHSFLKTRVDAA